MQQTTVRLDDELVDWLETDAQKYGRTVAQSIRYHLQRALAEYLREG